MQAGCGGRTKSFQWPRDDVRIYLCGKTNDQGLFTIFHEMGHVYYHLAFANQPFFNYFGKYLPWSNSKRLSCQFFFQFFFQFFQVCKIIHNNKSRLEYDH